MEAQFTPLLAEHLEAVAELERLCFSEPWSENALTFLLGDTALGLVALDENGRAIAYVGMLIAPDEGQITCVAVHPSARRQGLGRALIDRLILEAAARGLEQISLEVRVSNEAAIALYERAGFYRAGVRRNFYRKPTEDALVMLRKLQDLAD